MRLLSGMALLAIVFVLPACGPRQKSCFPVKGKVLDKDGKPATGAVVIFHLVNGDPKDPARPVGQVGDDGSYSLTTYKNGDGAPEGEYTVTVTWPAPKKNPIEPGGDQLNGQYGDPKTSKIKFTVEKKDNEVPEIKLTPTTPAGPPPKKPK
jgi:hypothetical protein